MNDLQQPPHDQADSNSIADEITVSARTRASRGKFWSRFTILLRRIHLYAGLFLLPWVFLYGVTAAMFNHEDLFSHATITHLPAGVLSGSSMDHFPAPDELARQVLASIVAESPGAEVELIEGHGAEFTNDLMFEVFEADKRHAVHVNPITRQSKVLSHPANDEVMQPLLPEVKWLKLNPDPQQAAKNGAAQALESAGVKFTGEVQPLGYSKLNFLARVNGELARVTYVVRDGHVDITRHEGHDGMTTRGFFLRMHTTHGQPPHWNGRMFWSLFVDAMAIAMVGWGLTGLVMWWQIKRTRMIGGVVLLVSLGCATGLYLALQHFYATTKL